MNKIERHVLVVLALSAVLLLASLYFFMSKPRAAAPSQQENGDTTAITIQHDDGWVTIITCMQGQQADPKKISVGRPAGVADCPHTELGVNQYKK